MKSKYAPPAKRRPPHAAFPALPPRPLFAAAAPKRASMPAAIPPARMPRKRKGSKKP